MSKSNLILKSALIVVAVMVAGVAAVNIRTLAWDDPFCSSFSADGTCCLKCSYHYFMDKNGKCCPVSDQCKTWDDKTGKCTSCFTGNGAPVNGVCSSSPVGSPPVVTPPHNPPVENPPVQDNCKVYGYLDISNKWVASTYKGCRKVCKVCDPGFYLTCDYTCEQLPENCLAADKDGNCTTCEDGYHVEAGVCVEDVDVGGGDEEDPNCAEWGYIDGSKKWWATLRTGCRKVCKCCIEGYYLNEDYYCVELPENCLAANPDGTCTECTEGYEVQDGVCVECVVEEPEDHCAEYGYIEKIKKKWYTYAAKGCVEVCKYCNEGYYLTEDYICVELPENCLAAEPDGTCTECAEGYEVQDGVCVECVVEEPEDHCAEYGYLQKIKKRWYTYEAKGCVKVCKCCEQGYYLTEDYTCAELPENCIDAEPDGTCNQCTQGYEVEEGVCVEIVGDPHCVDWGFLDEYDEWQDEEGEGCRKVCKCCEEGFYLNEEHTCVQLPENCLAADPDGTCTECDEGYDVEDGVCVEFDPCEEYGWLNSKGRWYSYETKGCEKICKCCKEGYWLDSNNECQQLPPNCEQVDEEGTCTCCAEGYKLKYGRCKKIRYY